MQSQMFVMLNTTGGYITHFLSLQVLPMWWECLSWVQIKFVFPANPTYHFVQHPYCHLPGLIHNRWHTLWASLTWCIWYQRNKLVFSGEAFDGQKVFEQALPFCWLWLNNFERNFNIPFHYWSSNIKAGFLYGGRVMLTNFLLLGGSQLYYQLLDSGTLICTSAGSQLLHTT